ncbi:TPM domain-containing protein [Ignavibacterium sp.]|uniref:TPM domain-containing protein n=1 Tax=Ignavibacterium sp. TaxID=2651167 RepID=UPI00307CE1BC
MKKLYLVFILFTVQTVAQIEIPAIKMWATDLTNTLTNSELDDLNYRLKTYEDSSSNQLVTLMISTLGGYPIEEVANEIFTKNKIGTKKNDNGVFLLIAKNDRKLRMEVGYGLEGVLPDALCSSIIRNVIVPRLKAEQYYLAISDGIDAIISAIGGEYITDKSDEEESPISSMFIIILILLFIFIFRRSGGVPGGVYRSGGFGGWGSGGSGWGGGGGFSGGGGSSGGGGASGSW